MAFDPHLLDSATLPPHIRTVLVPLLPQHLRRTLEQPVLAPAHQAELYRHLVALHAALQAMVPRWLAHDLMAPPAPPFHRAPATLLLADVTNFTPTTAALGRLGPRGAVELTQLLNHFFTLIVAEATARGGDVLAFGGDAALVAFAGTDHALTATQAATAM